MGAAVAIKIKQMSQAERNARIVAGIRAEAGAGAPRDPRMQVKKHVAELATLMALIHGGDWQVAIDHEKHFVLVRKRGDQQQLRRSAI